MYLSSESGRCEACGQFFVREASLTKHHSNCSVAHKRSRQLWKNGPSNIKKLNALGTDSRKRQLEEVHPHEDFRELELVRMRVVLIFLQTCILPGCTE
jgi:hypothetical protein